MKPLIFLIIILFLTGCNQDPVWAKEYTNEQIANAIYWAEGGAKAKVPYGILSIKVKDKAEARQICFNTIRNQRIRHAKHNCGLDFISCLGSRYCPIGAKNDPKGLNKNWVKNVKFYLEKQK